MLVSFHNMKVVLVYSGAAKLKNRSSCDRNTTLSVNIHLGVLKKSTLAKQK